MKTIIRHLTHNREVMTVQEFANYVGVSRISIYQRVYNGLPVIKSKGHTWIPVKEAMNWLKKRYIK